MKKTRKYAALRLQKNFVQNRKGKFYLQKYHKLGYDIERMFEHKFLRRKRTSMSAFHNR